MCTVAVEAGRCCMIKIIHRTVSELEISIKRLAMTLINPQNDFTESWWWCLIILNELLAPFRVIRVMDN